MNSSHSLNPSPQKNQNNSKARFGFEVKLVFIPWIHFGFLTSVFSEDVPGLSSVRKSFAKAVILRWWAKNACRPRWWKWYNTPSNHLQIVERWNASWSCWTESFKEVGGWTFVLGCPRKLGCAAAARQPFTNFLGHPSSWVGLGLEKQGGWGWGKDRCNVSTDVQGGPRHHDRWVIIHRINGWKYMRKWGEETLVIGVIISS